MTREELSATVIEFLDSFTTMTLASSIQDEPWAAAVYYARHGFDLIFFSSPASRHSGNFLENPRAAAAVHGEYQGWKEIKGLQMTGSVEPISGAMNLTRATATYLRRYPFVKEFFSDPGSISSQLAAKIAKVALYEFRPESIWYVDNSGGFGNRWKLEIRNGKPFGDPTKG